MELTFILKNINKKSIFFLYVSFIIIMLTSCEVSTEIETTEEETVLFVPTPINKFAIDKETETEEIEETKANHIYSSDFVLAPEKEIVIGEKQFLTKINYIYNHIDDFADSLIKVEGMYGMYYSWDKTFSSPMVYRNGPGCCGDDQYGGFYLRNIDAKIYEIDDWIEVSGKPFIEQHIDSEGETQKFLFLFVQDIKVKKLKERKAEMVNN